MDEVEDLNQLIRELNTERPPATEAGSSVRLEGWLRTLVERGGSDLLLVAGAPPSLRVDGKITPLREAPLAGDEVDEAVLPVLSSRARAQYAKDSVADVSYKVRGLGRFRLNLHRERGRAAAAIRSLPSEPPRLASLGLPPGTEALTRLPRGLVLVGGATGSGKTTTLAAVLTQTLLPRKGGGRVAAAELLFVSYGARQHIRKNALQHLHQEIVLTKKQGSITLEESLARIAREGLVETEEARARAAHPEDFENHLRAG